MWKQTPPAVGTGDWVDDIQLEMKHFRGTLDRVSNHMAQLAYKHLTQLIYKFRNRAFFIAGNSIPGLAPTAAQPGDEIFIFEGGQMCYVLRRTGEEYRLVGDYYLQGLMQNEIRGREVQHLVRNQYKINGECIQTNWGPVAWEKITII